MLALEEAEIRQIKFAELWRLLNCKDTLMFQPLRLKWLKDDDMNSKFFLKRVKVKAKRNSLKALKVQGSSLDSPTEFRRIVVDYFTTQVIDISWMWPTLDEVPFSSISKYENCG